MIKSNQPTILMMMAAATGHLNATFTLARNLERSGYRVVYAAEDTLTSDLIRGQGFTIVRCPVQLYKSEDPLGIKKDSFVDRMVTDLQNKITHAKRNEVSAAAFRMRRVVMDLNPDLLLLDVFLSCNYLLLNLPGLKVIQIHTMLCPAERSGLPPLSSNAAIGKAVAARWAWRKYYFHRRLRNSYPFRENIYTITESLLGSDASNALVKDQTFCPRLRNTKQIIMAPTGFDLPQFGAHEEMVYSGSQVNRGWPAGHVSPEIAKLLDTMQLQTDGTIWVYCSMGTLNEFHYKSVGKFLQQVVDAFANRDEFRLVMATGMVRPQCLTNLSDNIWLFPAVPQQDVLARCDVFITHGGLNSVLEAIRYRVPVLVYPLNQTWDQPGNAARVAYHRIGISGNIERVSVADIRNNVCELRDDRNYHDRLIEMDGLMEENYAQGIADALALVREVTGESTGVHDAELEAHSVL